jgi:hypothetical protein
MLLPKSTEIMTDLAPAALRRLSEGSFEVWCGRCMRFSVPIEAVGAQHAWSELIKEGWTWCASAGNGAGGPMCMECLKATRRDAMHVATPKCTKDTAKCRSPHDSDRVARSRPPNYGGGPLHPGVCHEPILPSPATQRECAPRDQFSTSTSAEMATPGGCTWQGTRGRRTFCATAWTSAERFTRLRSPTSITSIVSCGTAIHPS